MFTIEKNKLKPNERISGFASFLRTLKIGDSFLCEKRYQSGLYPYGKSLGIKLTSRKEGDGKIRVWRIE